MARHRFDPVALVFGGVFVTAGLIVLSGGELTDEGRALVPAGLVALGVALLIHVGRRNRPSPDAAGPPAEGATLVDPPEADPTGVVETMDPDATEVVDPTERYERPPG